MLGIDGVPVDEAGDVAAGEGALLRGDGGERDAVLRSRDIRPPPRQTLTVAPERPAAPCLPQDCPSHTSKAEFFRLRGVSFNRGAADNLTCPPKAPSP